MELVWNKEKKTAPFSKKTGSLLSFANTYSRGEDEVLREVSEPFCTKLTITDFDNGWRSAHRVIWTDDEGRNYPMFISEFLALVKKYHTSPLTTFPSVNGKWRVVKKGANFGISFIEEIQ